MAITLGVGPVDATDTANTDTVAVTLSGVTAGRSLVVGVRWHDATVTISSISCSGESNLTVHASPIRRPSLNDVACQFASLANVTASGDKTITVTFSGIPSGGGVHWKGIFALEVIGGDTSSFYNADGGEANSSTNPTTTITTTTDNCLVVAEVIHFSSPPTAGSGYTVYNLTQVYAETAEYDLDVGAAGIISVPFVHASSGGWVIKAAAFNALDLSVNITPGVGSLGLTGIGAVAEESSPIKTPSAGSLALTGVAPTVTNTASANVTAGAGSLVLTGVAPSISSATVITPAVGALTLAFVAPTVTVGVFGSSSLEEMTGTGVSVQSPVTTGAATLERMTGTGEASFPNDATGSSTLERITGIGYTPVEGAPLLKKLTGTGQAGIYASGAPSLKRLVVVSTSGAASLERIAA